ncbi:MAG: hypothetical protein KJ970_15255 [Candidatus Eisenbacteria bacterium]|uniref:T9SS type A sorting domain-containing protein n=1 Tax=Eiseniibacteriota bacterium TaxID=2212470 RepID=A0A948RZ68_UNCEI|nr:hypothetical protein [Candidatus Eisenbacteria bacterium]MBU1947989.1 hypothetical protein [Candidatus Eisenbacteria bacterium]MBU2692279.1 hypothetical protein [Candidatus Eisenbacteria bacterium]
MLKSNFTTPFTRLPAALFALLFALPPASAGADGGDLLWRYPGIENVVCIDWIEDIDGDGRPDVLMETYDAGASGDHLYAISGASSGLGDLIWSIHPPGGPSNSGGYGDACLRTAPDLNGDNVQDVLLGTAWGGRTVYAIDGPTGGIIWDFDTYSDSPPTPPESGWVYGVNWIGDNTGDGIPEIIFCTGSDSDAMYCVNGATGAVLWYLLGPDAFFDCCNIGDVNGDGYDDAAFGSGDSGQRLTVMSGPGLGGGVPHQLWYRDYSGTVYSVAALPDINGDDIPEVLAGAWNNTVTCHSGANGTVLWTGPVGSYVMRIDVIGDVNDDGTPDIAVASWASLARVISGSDGTTLWTTPVGDDCWAIDGIEDVTGDGIPDVVAGSFDQKIYLMNGIDGTIEWYYTTNAKLLSVRGTPDLDGNNVPDVIGGTQRLTVGGDIYAVQGGEPISDVNDQASGSLTLAGFPGVKAQGPLALTLNQPNPFLGRTQWRMETVRDGLPVTLDVINTQGQRIRRLASKLSLDRGIHTFDWDTRNDHGRVAPAGIYFLRLTAAGETLTSEKAVLVR